ncbi:MAG: hypothetical protein R2722_10225 [Tessaracoccus sp.]
MKTRPGQLSDRLPGCNGTAVVVDGRRDIAVYQDLAAKNGMKIIAVTETHIHADYLRYPRTCCRHGREDLRLG